jgi:hypothetical protein
MQRIGIELKPIVRVAVTGILEGSLDSRGVLDQRFWRGSGLKEGSREEEKRREEKRREGEKVRMHGGWRRRPIL